MSLAGLCLAMFPTQVVLCRLQSFLSGEQRHSVQGNTFHLPVSSLKPTPAEDWLHLPVFSVLPIENRIVSLPYSPTAKPHQQGALSL